MSTTEWYIYVTPEFMYSLGGADYSATLTIGGNTYTITVPGNIALSDGSHQWYPAVGLLGDKVYGEAQYLADQISVENYTTVKFLSEPVDVTFGDGFAASANGDGTWGVAMTHAHAWAFAVSADGTTLTATCGNAGCPVGGETSVALALSSGDKTYDARAVTAAADFDASFMSIFPGATATISIAKDGNAADTILDAGEYAVSMVVGGLGDGQEYPLSGNVTISKVDITGATLTFTPANSTYNGEEQSTALSVAVNGLDATLDNGSFSATDIGTYPVTVSGTGNFTGTVSGEWEILNTTGEFKSVVPTADGFGEYDSENNALTITDSTALEYSNGSWFAGIALEWPVETKGYSGIGQYGYAHYIPDGSAQFVASDGEFTSEQGHGSYQYNLVSSREFDYLSNTTWRVEITPAIVEAALSDGKTALTYTMRAGAYPLETYEDGVAFADYIIMLPLDESVEFVLGEGETCDLGATVLTTTKIQLAPGASVTSDSAQTVEGAIYVDVIGYDIVCTAEGGRFVYAAQQTHVHEWSAAVAENGYELVATCATAADCDLNGGEVRMWLDVGTTEKVYDGNSVTRVATFGDGFMTAFPDAGAALTVNGVENGVINDAGEYAVVLTVTGVGETTYTLSRTVTVSPVDISEAALVLTPATTTYNGEAQTVSPSVTAGGVTATLENNGLVVVSGTCTETDMGTYSVTVEGTGNFTGTATATWEIENTTGEPTSVAASAEGVMTNEGNDFTLADSSKLEYDAEEGVWSAGITITWPVDAVNASLSPLQNGHAYYVRADKMQLKAGENTYAGSDLTAGPVKYSDGVISAEETDGSYRYLSGLSLKTEEFKALATTTWKVALTPAIVEAALADEQTELSYTMNAGAFDWGDSTEGGEGGVAFADYTITVPLDEPVVFVLGEGETYDLGETVLTTTKIQLAPGASVTSDNSLAKGLLFTTKIGYKIVWSVEGGKNIYTALRTHVHDWRAAVAENDYELVAMCSNAADCDINGGEVKMWLEVGTTEKTYDGNSVTRVATFGDGFKTVYPDVAVLLTVNGVENGVINDAGEYAVELTVTGVGETTYTLSRTVTVSKVDISGAALVLTPATTTYNGQAQTVSPSVTVGDVTATLENNGLAVVSGTCTETDMGTYSVTVEGNGNFTGTAATATWTIENTTGAPTSVAASAEGSMTNEGNDFTLSDSSKLEYDAENEVWYAGITITWPMEKHDSWTTGGYAHYVTEAAARVTSADGSVSNDVESDKFRANLLSGEKDFDYLATTTWKVPLTPAIIKAALAEEKTSLTYTMNAGAFDWGDSTEGGNGGVAFADYTITIPLDENLKLFNADGEQVYPEATAQTIIEEIKSDIAGTVSSEVAESAAAKIDLLADVVGDGNEQAVADWVDAKKGGDAAAFYEELAQSEYVKASFALDTEDLITDASDVEVAEFTETEDGFTFAVKIDGGDIEAARVKAASIVKTATALDGEFGSLAADRIEISEEGVMTVTKAAGATSEFFTVVIDKD